MPLDRLVLILVAVTAAAALTVWVGATVMAAAAAPGWAALAAVPAALVVYVLWRVIAERVGSAEDDRYDRVER